MFIINTFSTYFGHHYAHLQENKTYVRTITLTVLTPHNAAPHNRYQLHPAESAQHTTCSNTSLVLLKMGIMMPETCWESVDNKHLTVASCWFFFSLTLQFAHDARSQKPEAPKCLFHPICKQNGPRGLWAQILTLLLTITSRKTVKLCR